MCIARSGHRLAPIIGFRLNVLLPDSGYKITPRTRLYPNNKVYIFVMSITDNLHIMSDCFISPTAVFISVRQSVPPLFHKPHNLKFIPIPLSLPPLKEHPKGLYHHLKNCGLLSILCPMNITGKR